MLDATCCTLYATCCMQAVVAVAVVYRGQTSAACNRAEQDMQSRRNLLNLFSRRAQSRIKPYNRRSLYSRGNLHSRRDKMLRENVGSRRAYSSCQQQHTEQYRSSTVGCREQKSLQQLSRAVCVVDSRQQSEMIKEHPHACTHVRTHAILVSIRYPDSGSGCSCRLLRLHCLH